MNPEKRPVFLHNFVQKTNATKHFDGILYQLRHGIFHTAFTRRSVLKGALRTDREVIFAKKPNFLPYSEALMPKIGNEKKSLGLRLQGVINTGQEDLQIAKDKSVELAQSTLSWCVLCDLHIFSGSVIFFNHNNLLTLHLFFFHCLIKGFFLYKGRTPLIWVFAYFWLSCNMVSKKKKASGVKTA